MDMLTILWRRDNALSISSINLHDVYHTHINFQLIKFLFFVIRYANILTQVLTGTSIPLFPTLNEKKKETNLLSVFIPFFEWLQPERKIKYFLNCILDLKQLGSCHLHQNQLASQRDYLCVAKIDFIIITIIIIIIIIIIFITIVLLLLLLLLLLSSSLLLIP